MALQLVATVGGEAIVIPLQPGVNRLGRSTQPQFGRFPGVSRAHADIVVASDKIEIHDLGSRNRTRVNGLAVRSRILQQGDEVEMGELRLVLQEDHNGRRVAGATGDGGESLGQAAPSTARTQKLRGTRLLGALAKLAVSLVRNDAPDDACQRSLARIAAVFRFRAACLFLIDEVGQLELRCAHGGQGAASDPVYSRSMVETVLRRREPLLVTDTHRGSAPWQSARLKGIRSAVAVPMLHDDEIIGVIYLDQEDAQRPFTRRHLQELQVLANLIAAKLYQCRFRIEMHSAAQIQRHMLRDQPLVPPGFEVAMRLQPCRLVAGDFYEILELSGGRYLYALGDVSGKGVAAALIMAETLASLRVLAPTTTSPLQLMLQLQSQLAERLAPRNFVTLFLGILDSGSRRFDYVNAGHEPGVLLAPGCAPEWLHSTGPPMGMPIPVPLQPASTDIPAGGLFGMWSDGLTEALCTRAQATQMFTRQRLLSCLQEVREAPVTQIVRHVFEAIDAFTGDPHPQDDRTLLVLKGQG